MWRLPTPCPSMLPTHPSTLPPPSCVCLLLGGTIIRTTHGWKSCADHHAQHSMDTARGADSPQVVCAPAIRAGAARPRSARPKRHVQHVLHVPDRTPQWECTPAGRTCCGEVVPHTHRICRMWLAKTRRYVKPDDLTPNTLMNRVCQNVGRWFPTPALSVGWGLLKHARIWNRTAWHPTQ